MIKAAGKRWGRICPAAAFRQLFLGGLIGQESQDLFRDVRQKSHRKMLIDTFINAIFLYDDKMVITFHYKDGTDTITIDDLKLALDKEKLGSDLDCSTAPKMLQILGFGAFFLTFLDPFHRGGAPCIRLRITSCEFAEVWPFPWPTHLKEA